MTASNEPLFIMTSDNPWLQSPSAHSIVTLHELSYISHHFFILTLDFETHVQVHWADRDLLMQKFEVGNVNIKYLRSYDDHLFCLSPLSLPHHLTLPPPSLRSVHFVTSLDYTLYNFMHTVCFLLMKSFLRWLGAQMFSK